MRVVRLLLTSAALLAFMPVAAALEVPPTLVACARLARDNERLDCFDREVARLTGTVPAAAPASPVDVFGANPKMQSPVPPPQAAPRDREELAEITAKISSIGQAANGRLRIALDNGQLWQETAGAGALLLKPGMQVRIIRGSLGSFLLVAPNKRSARVHRLR